MVDVSFKLVLKGCPYAGQPFFDGLTKRGASGSAYEEVGNCPNLSVNVTEICRSVTETCRNVQIKRLHVQVKRLHVQIRSAGASGE